MKALISIHFIAAILGMILVVLPVSSIAQGTLNALTYAPYTGGYSPNLIVVNYTGVVSWSFTPNADLLVSAISSTAPQVSFWLGTNQVIASYAFTGSTTDFQSVPALLLSAGQMYSVSTQCSNTTFGTYFLGSGSDDATFAKSSYISQFESYVGAPNDQFGASSTYLYSGPNFQFEPVPEPIFFDYLLPTFCIWLYFVAKKPRT